jgi:hypothetical protein
MSLFNAHSSNGRNAPSIPADGGSFQVEVSSRPMGLDPGKDRLVHDDQILECAINFRKGEHPK